MKLLFLEISVLLLITGCTSEEARSKQVVDLEKSYHAAQEELAKYDAKIKAASGDEGLLIQYNYEKELAKSRAERIKTQLKKLSPASIIEAAPQGGGH